MCSIVNATHNQCVHMNETKRRPSSTSKFEKNDAQIDLKQVEITANKIKCMYANARSLVNKREELELSVEQNSYDIIGFTETWLNEYINDAEIELQGYKIFRKDRKSDIKTRGGGVMLYIKDNINVVLREDICDDRFPEALFCSIESSGEKTLLGICYRPPDSSIENDSGLYNLINRISIQNSILMGDFNFNELTWHKPETLSDDHPFVKILNDNFLFQLVYEPSRGNNFLDLLMSSDENIVDNVVVGEPFGTSDHCKIEFNVVINKIKSDRREQFYNYFKADYQQITEAAIVRQWDVFSYMNANDFWIRVKEELLGLRNEFIPKNGKSKFKSKWITKTVIKNRRSKVKAWNKFLKSGKDKKRYKIYQKKLNKSIKINDKAKRDFEHKLADNIKSDCKSFFAYARSKERNKVKAGPLKDSEGNVVTNNKSTADIFNDYFASVFTTEDTSFMPTPDQIFNGSQMESLSDVDIVNEVVYNRLSKLNIQKCPGADDLHPKLLWEVKCQLTSPLTKLFRLSLDTGVVPDEWKEARVLPL